MQPQHRSPRVRTRRRRAGRWHARLGAAVPERDLPALRRGRLRVAGDHLEAGRRRGDPLEGLPPVVDRRPRRRDGVSVDVQRRHPVRRRLRRAAACRPAAEQRVGRRERVRRPVAHEAVVVGRARRVHEHDRVVGVAMAERAVADEVHALQSPQHGRAVRLAHLARLLLRDGGGRERGHSAAASADHERDPHPEPPCRCSHLPSPFVACRYCPRESAEHGSRGKVRVRES